MRNKKIEKTQVEEKQSHEQDNIYVVRQFIYVFGVVGISLLSGEKLQMCGSIVLKSIKNNDNNNKTLITKKRFLHLEL